MVIAVIAIVTSLLLPTLGAAKTKAQGIQCLNNHRQLSSAWKMYTDDNEDRLLFSMGRSPQVWMSGELDFDPNNPSNWDVERDINRSPLWPYCGQSVSLFKCPANKSAVRPASGPFKNQIVPRVRSMSMNYWIGGIDGKDLFNGSGPGWCVYLRFGDLIDPGPARTWVFLDAREDGITSGGFLVDMTGYPDKAESRRFFQDWPGGYHNRAGGLSFADGHSEIKKWTDARTTPPIMKGGFISLNPVPGPHNRDILWLQERSTRKIP